MSVWLHSILGDWKAEHECSLCPSPGEMDSDMSRFSKWLIFFLNHLLLLLSITRLVGSWVPFGSCALEEPGLEFVGWSHKSTAGPRERDAFVRLPPHYLASYSVSFRSCALPALIFYICHLGKILLWFLLLVLHPQLWTRNIINIPFVYSVMEFVYLFYFSIFWTKIFVSFCWNVHTVNVC